MPAVPPPARNAWGPPEGSPALGSGPVGGRHSAPDGFQGSISQAGTSAPPAPGVAAAGATKGVGPTSGSVRIGLTMGAAGRAGRAAARRRAVPGGVLPACSCSFFRMSRRTWSCSLRCRSSSGRLSRNSSSYRLRMGAWGGGGRVSAQRAPCRARRGLGGCAAAPPRSAHSISILVARMAPAVSSCAGRPASSRSGRSSTGPMVWARPAGLHAAENAAWRRR